MKRFFVRWLWMGFVSLAACHKKQADAAYSTSLALVHLVPNADSVSALYDENKITGTRALSYGTATSQNGQAYLTLPGGTHNLRILSGTTAIKDNIYVYRPGRHYSLFLYDSLKSGTIKTALVPDPISTVDTLAQVRFINMIADTGSIQIIFRKDTTLNTSDVYLGSKASLAYPFSTLRPGSWSISLSKNGAVIVQPALFELQAGKLYSFVAKGVKGSTGLYAEGLLQLKHN